MQSGKPSANELSSVRPLQHAFLRMERLMGIALRLNPSYSLRERGKLAKVALVACMRKLLTIVNARRRDELTAGASMAT